MPVVNITLSISPSFAWQFGKAEWNDEKRAAIFSRFWSKVQRADAKDCWLWTGHIASTGYGVFGCASQRFRAHRFAWMASRGPIPDGLEVCHRCDRTACVNPDHLFLGSRRDNHLDSVRKGRKRAWGLQKLNAEQVNDSRQRAAGGELQYILAREYGVAKNTVSGIVNRKSWAHLDHVPTVGVCPKAS